MSGAMDKKQRRLLEFIRNSTKLTETREIHTKIFAKAGLENVTSAICKHQLRFKQTFINFADGIADD